MAALKNHPVGVCFLLEDFYPIVNGAAIQIMLLAERLVSLGLQVTVITRQIRPEHSPYETIKGIDVVRVKPAIGLRRIGKYLMLAPALFALIRQRNNYQFVIACNMRLLGMLAVLVAKVFGKTSVLRAECCGELDGSYIDQFGPPPSKLKLAIVKVFVALRNMMLMRADSFLSISSSITQEMVSCGVSREQVIEITNGVDVRRFAPVTREAKALLRQRLGLFNRKYFIYTGRLGKGKGLEYLLHVWKAFMGEYQDAAHLLIVGGGGEQAWSWSCDDELKTFVKENDLDKTVTFTGNVSNVDEYLQAGDYFIFPSEREALGLSLIEALSCELPSVASRIGGIPDIIEDHRNGILVPSGDKKQLLRAMKELIENEKTSSNLGREGRRTVLDKFDIDNISKQYVAQLNQLNKSRIVVNA